MLVSWDIRKSGKKCHRGPGKKRGRGALAAAFNLDADGITVGKGLGFAGPDFNAFHGREIILDAISQALYKKTKSNFDPVTQLDAVAGLAASPSALLVANDVPAKTVAELVAYSKTLPKKMDFASAGVGSVSHLNFEVFMDKTGMQAVHVPYKGGGQAIGDVVAGHVPMTITSVQAVKSLVEAGKVRALAVTSPTRSPAMPNVPTMQEAGVPPADVELRFWFAVFGPKGLPDAVKTKLYNAISKVMNSPAVHERLAKLDITPDVIDGPAMHAKLQSEIKNWTRFVDAKGIKAE